MVIQDRGESFTPAEAVASDAAAPAIAVLPFSVTGEGLDEWREGTVNLLSTNLDGAAGLRAIDSRTVLAQWDRQMGEDSDGDRETALRVAGATGARWALLGSAVAIGPRVRLAALDTVPVEVLQAVLFAGISLRHSIVHEEVGLALEARGESLEFGGEIWRVFVSMNRGRIQDRWAAVRGVSFPLIEAGATASLSARGVSVPADIVELVLEAESETASTPWLGIWDAADGFRAILAWETGQPEIYDERLGALADGKEQARAAGEAGERARAPAMDDGGVPVSGRTRRGSDPVPRVRLG